MQFIDSIDAMDEFDSDCERISMMIGEVPDSFGLSPEYVLPDELENVLRDLAADGRIIYEWKDIKVVIRYKITQIFDKYFEKLGFVGPITETFESRRDEIIRLLESSEVPPFTTQRLAEVLIDPFSQYKSTHKLMNGVEKLLSVTCSE